ncbi:MAG: CZB domain-containing protein [Sulfuricurvum sp.]
MDKAKTLELLGEAKKAHIQWVQRAKHLIEGLPIDQSAIPLGSTDCIFGQWFYGEGQKLHGIGNMDCLMEVEKSHFELHDHYMNIFKIYFGETNRSLLAKIFNSKKKVSDQEKEMARIYFSKLQDASTEVLELISRLERRLYALPQSSFDAI